MYISIMETNIPARLYVLIIFADLITNGYTLSLLGREAKCESNRAALCEGLYNETRIPNTPHRSQDDNILDLNQYQRLINTRCAKNLRLFLCSFFIPMCTILDEDLKPCRSLCEEVKEGCEVILRRYVDLPWPHQLRCEQFSDDRKTVCIGNPKPKENHVIKTVEVQPDKRVKVDDDVKIVLKCQESKSISLKKIIHEKNNCVRSASQETIKRLCNGEKKCEFQLKDLAGKSGQKNTCTAGNVGPSGLKYTCIKNEESNAKTLKLNYGQDESLHCKSNSRHIVIKGAQFNDEKCMTPNAFCYVSQLCTGRHNCVLWADARYIGSTCKGERLRLSVTYDCARSSIDEKEVIKDLDIPGSAITLGCTGGQISIIRAEYKDQACRNLEIHCAVNYLCEKKSDCTFNKQDLAAVECKKGQRIVQVRYVCT